MSARCCACTCAGAALLRREPHPGAVQGGRRAGGRGHVQGPRVSGRARVHGWRASGSGPAVRGRGRWRACAGWNTPRWGPTCPRPPQCGRAACTCTLTSHTQRPPTTRYSVLFPTALRKNGCVRESSMLSCCTLTSRPVAPLRPARQVFTLCEELADKPCVRVSAGCVCTCVTTAPLFHCPVAVLVLPGAGVAGGGHVLCRGCLLRCVGDAMGDTPSTYVCRLHVCLYRSNPLRFP